MAGFDYLKLVETMRKANLSDEEIVSALKNFGMTKKDAEELIGKTDKPKRQAPPQPPQLPKTIAKTPSQESDVEPEERLHAPHHEVRVPGRFAKIAKAIGDDTHEAFARTFEKRYGLMGKRLANSLRERRGLTSPHDKKGGGGGDKDLARDIDKATQTIVSSVSHLGSTVEKVLSKVDYGVRNSTDKIVKELDRITDRLKRQEYKDTETESEAGTTEAAREGEAASGGSGIGMGSALLAGGAAGLLGMGLMGTGEAKAASSTDVEKEGEDKQIAAKQDTQNQDIEWKAEKITFTADEAVFSSAFDRVLAGGGAGSLTPEQAGSIVGGMAGNDPTGDSGSFRRGGGRAGRDRSGRYDTGSPGHGQAAKGKRGDNMYGFYKGFKKGNFSDAAARLMTANVTGESINDPANNHWDRSHYSQGIVQWDPQRAKAIYDKFGKYPKDMSPEEQGEAAAWEINNNPRFARVKSALNDPDLPMEEKMRILQHVYEANADPEGQTTKRMGFKDEVDKTIDLKTKQEQEAQKQETQNNQEAQDTHNAPKVPSKDETPKSLDSVMKRGPQPLSDNQFNGRFGPQPLSDAQFNSRVDPPQPLSDAQFLSRVGGNGSQIEDMSTQSKVDSEKPTVVNAGSGKKDAPDTKTERTVDDENDDKDSAPPPTSIVDHYKDFLGIGITKTPGLGL